MKYSRGKRTRDLSLKNSQFDWLGTARVRSRDALDRNRVCSNSNRDHGPCFSGSQVKDICNELDVRSLCHKILQNVSTLLNADRGSLFLVQGGGLSACQHDHHHRPVTKRVCSPRRPHASITVGCLSKDDRAAAAAAAAAVADGGGEPQTQQQQHHHHHNHHHFHHHLHGAVRHRRPSCGGSGAAVVVPNAPPSPPPDVTTTNVPVTTTAAAAPPVEEAAVSGLIVGSPIGSTNVGSLKTSVTAAATASHHFQGCQSKCLVSKLFDVCSMSTLQEMEKKKEIHIPWGTGIVGYVAESGEPVNIPDAYKVNSLFQNVVPHIPFYRKTS